MFMQMHCPTRLPDESLYNLTARFARLNGYWNHLVATRDFLGVAKATSIADCPLSCYESLSDNLYLYGEPYFLESHLTSRLLARHLGDNPLSKCETNQQTKVVKGSNKNTTQFLESIYGLNPHWRVCHACAEKNLVQYGVNYWQRAHQLPTSLVCHTHGLALIESSLPRKRLHDHLWMPTEAPVKSKVNFTNINSHWRVIAETGFEGLQDISKPFHPNVIKKTILQALRHKGLTTTQDKLLSSKYNASFDEFFGVNFRYEMRVEMGIKNPTVLLKGIVNEMNANALYRVILVYWLFGSWKFFKEYCRWSDIFIDIDVACYSRVINEVPLDAQLSRARKACLAYVNESALPTRNQFIKSHYRDFNWLLRHDRAWLDKLLPIVKAWKQSNIFDGF